MSKSNKNKGDDKMMEHKDVWLVLGLTIVLAIAVSISTVSITGDAIFGKKVTMQKAPTTINPQLPKPSCVWIDIKSDEGLVGTPLDQGCVKAGLQEYTPVAYEVRTYKWAYSDNTCSQEKVKYITDEYQIIKSFGKVIPNFGQDDKVSILKCTEVRPPTSNYMKIFVSYTGAFCCK